MSKKAEEDAQPEALATFAATARNEGVKPASQGVSAAAETSGKPGDLEGFVRRNAHGVWAMLESGHEQPVPIFQQLARSDPSGRDDVCAVPAVAAQR
jgi:hypothetical protein